MVELIPIICTYDVEPSVLSSIVETAYTKSEDTSEALLVLSDTSRPAIQRYTVDDFTRPPVDQSFKSPFIGWSLERIAKFLKDNADDTAVGCYYFLVADERTSADNSLLFVDTLFNESEDEGDDEDKAPDEPLTVRLAPEFVNSYTVAIAIGSMGTNELVDETDEDGVYRGGASDVEDEGEGFEESDAEEDGSDQGTP
ncbi:hypothetical protein CIHG_04991 [Coccidioides immitis H538.4]|uniref:DUF6924 domain-containing protein n=3 Tax=Coccidioides immitis TaxID=5501 RepID=A0A0J8QP96_COCIT|nr:hypothetical protein CIRG_03923 [Coccidioides immitis RMSCC 2394]KMU74010.1 hypothetical protein CISG_10263 [Coccidioides immitis RMSCC 3703]KMU87051.1 hypothetical protein CIHG_04991 [Coccidioides immitis H538.4]TPX24338.1 hypothetical protein DIZ76_013684 [Coccidioides immitis]